MYSTVAHQPIHEANWRNCFKPLHFNWELWPVHQMTYSPGFDFQGHTLFKMFFFFWKNVYLKYIPWFWKDKEIPFFLLVTNISYVICFKYKSWWPTRGPGSSKVDLETKFIQLCKSSLLLKLNTLAAGREGKVECMHCINSETPNAFFLK